MKVAYSSNAYMKHTVAAAIERIAGLGYAGVELMADTPHLWPAEVDNATIDSVRRDLDKHGLCISNINAFMMNAVQDFWHPSWIEPEPERRQQRIQHTKDALVMAAKLGAPSITTEPGGPLDDSMTRQQAMDLFIEGLEHCLHVAEEVEVRLLVEPEPELLIENRTQFMQLAHEIQSPMFGLNFDVGHFYCVSEPLPETIEGLQTYTRHFHFEDIAASRIHEHLVPGRGAIDFDEVIAAINATGYDGWLTVELYPYLDDPDGAGAEALHFLQERLSR